MASSMGTDPQLLLKRRQDRQRASEKLQSKLDKAGIKKQSNDSMAFSSIPFVPLINQKNYYTEYLRKDDQFRMVRNTRETVLSNMKRRKMANGNSAALNINNINNTNTSSSNTPSATPKQEMTPELDEDISEMDIEVDGEAEGETPQDTRILVIHPGSQFIKIGWCNDIEAQSVLNVVAYKSRESHDLPLDPPRHEVERKNDIVQMVDSPNFKDLKAPIKESFKERMKYYKRRMLPNSTEQCLLFNRKGQVETIDDSMEDNDTIFSTNYQYGDAIVGEEVLKIGDLENWIIRSPFTSGSESGFNDTDPQYQCPEEILGDIELILRESLKTKFEINYKDYSSINVMLVLPNLYSKAYIETMVGLLLTRLNFKNVAVIQEALASSFGAGLSSGCIVDIGSRSIHIACVDEGVVLDHSRLELDYGINDVIRMWGKSLINQQLKWPVNLLDIRQFSTMQDLFKECATFDDEVIGIKTTHVIVRDRSSEGEGGGRGHNQNEVKIKLKKYLLKVWDDVMTCPMGLFYPEIFNESEEESILMKSTLNKINSGMLLTQLAPVRSIKSPILKNKCGTFEGYLNESSISALQRLQESKIYLSNSELKDILEIISEIYHDNEPNTAGGGGAKRAKPSKFHLNEWLDDKYKSQYNPDYSYNLSSNLRRNMLPLDLAIIESIGVGASEDAERMEKFWSNICVVGGGGCLNGIENMLIDRLHINRTNVMANTKLFECIKKMKDWRKGHNDERFQLSDDQLNKLSKILDSGSEAPIDVMGPSDLDPQTIGWKGGCVYSKLRVIEEMWVSRDDWELLGGRSIRYGGLFIN